MAPRCGARRCAAVCVLWLLLVQFWHKIACHIFVQTCSPLGLGPMILALFNLDPMPTGSARTASSAVVAAGQGDGGEHCEPLWREGEPRWVILLSSPKSGSTYVQQMLNSHPKIWFGRERILETYRDCRVRPEGHCGWAETQEKIEQVFQNYRDQAWYEGRQVVGFKIQYEHIAPELRPDFARWLACNEVDVLHLSRGAVVESFWTLQAEVLDAFQLKGEEKKLQVSAKSTKAKPDHLHSNKRPIRLDPALASDYVRAVEAQRTDYRQLLLYSPARVAYFELHYETLLAGRAGRLEWGTALAFLGLCAGPTIPTRSEGAGVPSEGPGGRADTGVGDVCGADQLNAESVKVHPGGCAAKITNWEDVRVALQGTDTVVACDSQTAVSSGGGGGGTRSSVGGGEAAGAGT